MSWGFRIVRYADGSGYGLHEVFYDSMQHPTAWTGKPIYFAGDTAEEVRQELRQAWKDAHDRAVLDQAYLERIER